MKIMNLAQDKLNLRHCRIFTAWPGTDAYSPSTQRGVRPEVLLLLNFCFCFF